MPCRFSRRLPSTSIYVVHKTCSHLIKLYHIIYTEHIWVFGCCDLNGMHSILCLFYTRSIFPHSPQPQWFFHISLYFLPLIFFVYSIYIGFGCSRVSDSACCLISFLFICNSIEVLHVCRLYSVHYGLVSCRFSIYLPVRMKWEKKNVLNPYHCIALPSSCIKMHVWPIVSAITLSSHATRSTKSIRMLPSLVTPLQLATLLLTARESCPLPTTIRVAPKNHVVHSSIPLFAMMASLRD